MIIPIFMTGCLSPLTISRTAIDGNGRLVSVPVIKAYDINGPFIADVTETTAHLEVLPIPPDTPVQRFYDPKTAQLIAERPMPPGHSSSEPTRAFGAMVHKISQGFATLGTSVGSIIAGGAVVKAATP